MITFEVTTEAQHHVVDTFSTIVYNVYDDETYLGYLALQFGEPDNMLHVHIACPISLGTRLKIFRHFKKHFPYKFTWDRSKV